MQDTVTISRELLRQVLKTLTDVWGGYELQHQITDSITALRLALDAPAVEQEPIGEVVACNDHGHPWKRISGYEWSLAELPVGARVYAAPQAQQPVKEKS